MAFTTAEQDLLLASRPAMSSSLTLHKVSVERRFGLFPHNSPHSMASCIPNNWRLAISAVCVGCFAPHMAPAVGIEGCAFLLS
jgi:hypothetical protein